MRGLAFDAYLIALRCTLPLGMRALPLPTLFRAIEPRFTFMPLERARRSISRSEAVAARLRVPNTCLYRAMVRFVALRASGQPAVFVMGVSRAQPDTGHAWVELAGVPVGEQVDDGLVPTYRYP